MSTQFARMAMRRVANRAVGGVRRFGGDGPHPTFERENYSPTLVGGLILGVMGGGAGAITFSKNFQIKKRGFDKNPVGFSP